MPLQCGTTSISNYLKLHPALSCLDGLNYHDVRAGAAAALHDMQPCDKGADGSPPCAPHQPTPSPPLACRL